MRKIAIGLILTFALISCSKKGAEQKGPFLAKVGNTTITQADYEREFQALPDYAQQLFADEQGKEKFLNEVINKEILYQEALKKGLDKTPEYKRKLEEFRKLTLVSELFEKEIMSKAKVSDQEVKEYYEKNKEDFAPTTQIRASHILVKTEDEAKKVLERLKKGEKFGDIARAVSIDKGSAKNGGDLGPFSKGQMVPEFERAAANLNVGEISMPVKTQFGYHIIKVTDRKKGAVIEFEKIKDMISQRLSGEKQKEAFDQYLAELKKSYKVEINKDALSRPSAETGEKESPQAEAEQQKKAAEEQGKK
ncbi:MAG: peptidylprolyl isomerase [Nitrospirota bacterium]|nr:peptidylprolyl isomerase [Nitrospirota bacterium]